MSQDTILGTDTGYEAFITKINNDFTECFVNIAEVVAGRSGYDSLILKMNQLDSAILAVTAGNGSLVSANDTTPGFLNGKMAAGDWITLTEGNDAGDETLTVAVNEILLKEKFLL
jgi:hypothetical protein